MSPASRRTTSPTTKSVDFTDISLPSRMTFALGVDISFNALMASSALASWKTPKTALIMTMAKMKMASTSSPVNAATIAAANKIAIIKSLNWLMNF